MHQQAGKEVVGRKIRHQHLVWATLSFMVIAASFSIGLVDMSGKAVVFAQDGSAEATHHKTSELVSDELAAFFESFDRNKDGRLQFSEAEAFYHWIEANIEYRSDSESVLVIVPRTEIPRGDGREGDDYRQTPTETFEERAGDCEDMATLALAFFDHFGVESYLAGVNALEPDELDHAVAIVRIPEDPARFSENLDRTINYYVVREGVSDIYGKKVSPGAYLPVDNAYADSFGYLNRNVDDGTFRIHCLIPLKYGYGDKWSEAVRLCLSSR